MKWWAAGCRLTASFERVDLLLARPASAGRGVEAAARDARYEIFQHIADRTQAWAILLAHHQHDQAETVLLQTIRGGGDWALAGMPPWRKGIMSSSGHHALLQVQRIHNHQLQQQKQRHADHIPLIRPWLDRPV